MTEESIKELRYCLRQLAHGLGFWRPDLVGKLQGSLTPLQRIWGVNVTNIELARKTIFSNLIWHIDQVVPRSLSGKDFLEEADQQRYRFAVLVSFNIVRDKRAAHDLRTVDLDDRRNWLDKKAPDELRISKRTSQRYFYDAVDQIVAQLTHEDYKPVIANEQGAIDYSPSAIEASAGIDLDAPLNEAIPSQVRDKLPTALIRRLRLPVGRKARIGTSIAAIAVLTVTVMVGWPFRGTPNSRSGQSDGRDMSRAPTAAQPPRSKRPAPEYKPVPPQSPSQPVLIEGITALQRLVGAKEFALPARVDLSQDQLQKLGGGMADDFGGDKVGFAEWYEKHDGTPIDAGTLSLILRGNDDQPVQITNLKAKSYCGDPFNGTVFKEYSQGGPGIVVQVGMVLDSPDPVLQEIVFTKDNTIQPGGPGYFTRNTIVLARGEVQKITFGAIAERLGCRFSLQLEVATSRGLVTEEFDNRGKPFMVTPWADMSNGENEFAGYSVAYIEDAGGVWSRCDLSKPHCDG